MRIAHIPFLLFNIFFITFCIAQTSELDSLKVCLKNLKNDTSKINLLNDISYKSYITGFEDQLKYGKEALELSKKLKWKKGEAYALKNIGSAYKDVAKFTEALDYYFSSLKEMEKLHDQIGIASNYNNIGVVHMYLGNYSESLKNHTASLKIRKSIGNKRGIAMSYTNIGIVNMNQGNYPEALKNYFAALKIEEESGDKGQIASAYTCIGNVFLNQKNFDESLKHHQLALKLFEEAGDKNGIAYAYNNLGNVYSDQDKQSDALKSYFIAIKIMEETGDTYGLATSYNNVGAIYSRQGNYSEALKSFESSLKMRQELGDNEGLAVAYNSIGALYLQTNKTAEGRKLLSKGLSLAKEIGSKNYISGGYRYLAKADSAMGNYMGAYANYKMHILYRDSILNEENTKKTIQAQMQYNFDKKQAADSLKVVEERTLTAVKFEQEKKQRYYLYAGLSLVLVFSGFVFNRYKVTQRQKLIIEQKEQETQHQNFIITQQKHIVEEKQKEILDSITYAKRLQEAILPPHEFIDKYLPQNFVIYKPKDIVAGDFYWAEKIGDLFFIAAADSTGHGVPGAMVSVVCSNALNRSVKEFRITDTGKILDKTRELILETFEKSTSDVKDGMDISLLCIDLKTRKISWSGANNPLWYFEENEMKEIKADKQPIGKTDDPKPFTTNEIESKEGTTFYLFTDGFADQFGGKNGKKFKYKQFNTLLKKNAILSMKEQASAIDKSFEIWKGQLEQVDDICVIGLKF